MTAKQLFGEFAPDGSIYGVTTDGNGNLLAMSKSTAGAKQLKSSRNAPDGSTYLTLADGNGNLI